MNNSRKLLISLSVIFFACFLFVSLTSASTGTIDPVYKYAWSNNAGWVNFACANCNVQVSDTAITGYAFSQNYGWINLGPLTKGGIINSNGPLSGSAWGQNAGWINFTGVSINKTTGQFSGSATGDIVGTLAFSNCGISCSVITTWRSTNGPGGGGPPVHSVCSNQQCVSISGVGTNQCSSDSECATHNICNLQKQCVAVHGSGINSCQANPDCNITHLECSNQQCVSVDGVGTGQCQANGDCAAPKHNECNAQKQCVSVNGAGGDLCQSNSDCNATHLECLNQQCVPVAGFGVTQCQFSTDCFQAKHNICNAQKQCVSADGTGSNVCQTDSDCGAGVSIFEKHNECQNQKCVLVDGQGTNNCQFDKDCNATAVPTSPTFPPITLPLVIKDLPETIKKTVDAVGKAINTTQGSVATKTITTTALVVQVAATATTVAASPFSLLELLLAPIKLMGAFFGIIKLKKKVLPWGVVYDSVTKQPLDPAYVSLISQDGKVVANAITDIDGRYGFIPLPGIYKMTANKTNYIFPSQKLAGKTEDELYSNLYFGGTIVVQDEKESIIKSIPLDPLRFDWNEFAKKNRYFMKFFSNIDLIIGRVSNTFFIVGFAVAIAAFFAAPYPYNLIVVVAYIALLLLRFAGLKPKAYGRIVDRATGNPLSFSILRVLIPGINKEISHKIADKYGRYYCLIPKGEYYVKIEKKNYDGSYSLAYVSEVIGTSRKGIIRERFKI